MAEETWIKFLAPAFGPAQSWLLWVFGESSRGWELSLSLGDLLWEVASTVTEAEKRPHLPTEGLGRYGGRQEWPSGSVKNSEFKGPRTRIFYWTFNGLDAASHLSESKSLIKLWIQMLTSSRNILTGTPKEWCFNSLLDFSYSTQVDPKNWSSQEPLPSVFTNWLKYAEELAWTRVSTEHRSRTQFIESQSPSSCLQQIQEEKLGKPARTLDLLRAAHGCAKMPVLTVWSCSPRRTCRQGGESSWSSLTMSFLYQSACMFYIGCMDFKWHYDLRTHPFYPPNLFPVFLEEWNSIRLTYVTLVIMTFTENILCVKLSLNIGHNPLHSFH